MGKIRKTYTKEEKFKEVQLYLEGERSYRDVASQLDISSTKTIRKWVEHYQEEVLRLRAENEYL